MRNALLAAVLAIVCSLPVCAQNYGGTQSNASGSNGPSPFKIEQTTVTEPNKAATTPTITIDPTIARTPESSAREEGRRLGLVIGKAIVDYAIIGFGLLIGALFVHFLTRKPKKLGA